MQPIQTWVLGLPTAALIAVVAVLLPLAAVSAQDSTGDAVPPGLRESIHDFLEGQDREYAGLCREIEQWQHYGEYCAFVLFESDTRALVSYAPVATDQIEHQYFVLEDGAWRYEPEVSDPEPKPTEPLPTPTAEPTAPEPEPTDPVPTPTAEPTAPAPTPTPVPAEPSGDGVAGLWLPIAAVAIGLVVAGELGWTIFRRRR